MLLVRARKRRRWQLPGGGLKRDETPREAARREVDEETGRQLIIVRDGVSLEVLVNGLNALGVGPRDMISILQAIKAAGALQAEIEVIG